MSASSLAFGKASRSRYRLTSVVVGLLFLTSTAAFMAGSSLIASYFSGETRDGSTLLTGVLLEVYCGLAVAGIGAAMFPTLRPYDKRLAGAYLWIRVLECVVIASVGAYMLSTERQLANYDAFIYVFTAVGGIVLSYLLYVSGLVPRWLSQLGLVGYMTLLVGVPVRLLDLAELDSGWGVVFIAPGGLFELILPVLLLVKGFHDST